MFRRNVYQNAAPFGSFGEMTSEGVSYCERDI